MSHSRRKAPEEHRSRHAAEDIERLRSHERRGEAPRLRSKARTGAVERTITGLAGGECVLYGECVGSWRQHGQWPGDPSDIIDSGKADGKKLLPTSASLETLRHRKESTQDESRFEPDYDEMIEDEPGSGGTADPALSQGARVASTKRRAVAVIDTLAGKKSRLAEEEALTPTKPNASPTTSTAPAASTVVALAAPTVSADEDRTSSSSSDSSDDEKAEKSD
ncbi:hypothetical protein MRX96_005938 [Rhipicephalus microplus]